MVHESPTRDYFIDTEIARMLGINPVTVRQWRVKNKKAGELKYGPPYEIRGSSVVYPKSQFREWCAAAPVVGGVPRLNLPVTADKAAIQQATANDGRQDVFSEIGRLGA